MIDSIDSRIKSIILHNVICHCKISLVMCKSIFFSRFILFIWDIDVIITPRLAENWFKSIVHLDSMMPFMMVGVCNTF